MRWLFAFLPTSLLACVGDAPADMPGDAGQSQDGTLGDVGQSQDGTTLGGVGQEGGACFPNATCNAGLQCVSGTCRKLTSTGACVLGSAKVGSCTLTR